MYENAYTVYGLNITLLCRGYCTFFCSGTTNSRKAYALEKNFLCGMEFKNNVLSRVLHASFMESYSVKQFCIAGLC